MRLLNGWIQHLGNMRDILKIIHDTRREKKIKMQDVAFELGISRFAYSRREKGDSEFTLADLKIISNMLDLELRFLVK